MTVKVAINGFGRIGRLVLRAMIESGRDDLEAVAINDLGSVEANAHLFRFDSVHGRFPGEVEVSGNAITIRHRGRAYGPIRVSAEREPSKVPYQGVDVALECTGRFTSKEAASALIWAGARKVLVSAPAEGVDATIVYGVNHKTITPDMTVISNASCTTNCLAPMAKVLHENFGVERGYMVTIHAYTGDQNTVDTLHHDLHRARAAAVSAIPTSTGAAKAVGLVLPELKGKLDGTAIRIPTPNVSLVSLDVNLRKQATAEEINAAMRAGGRRRAAGHSRLQYAKAGEHRLQPRAGVLQLRCDPDHGGRRRAGAGDGLVRQRVGLLQSHGGHRRVVRAALRPGGRMSFRTLDGLDVAGRRVLLRADLNVPLRDGKITDRSRIERLSPTIRELSQKGAKVIVCSHFDRPKGKRIPEMSLAPLVPALAEALGRKVYFVEDCIGTAAEQAVERLNDGDVVVLENTRFHAEEEKNDPAFAASLARLADVYVDDAFSTAHRAHASTEGVAKLLPSYAGRLMQAELEALEAALGNPARPVAAIVGGAKVSTKLELLGNLIGRVDVLIVVGAMANTFLAAQGLGVGTSLQEAEMRATAGDILARAQHEGCELVLPVDAVVAAALKPDVATRTVSVSDVPADMMILDVGPRTVSALIARLDELKTLVWNGPLGAFETPPFDAGTAAFAKAVADATAAGRLRSVVGGGDTVAALRQAGVVDRMSYVSTAGGAFLEWMEGKTLPGVAVLET